MDVVKYAKRPPKPEANIDCGLDDQLWSLIEDCWSQEPSNRPTAATVSLRLGNVNVYSVGPEFVQPQTTFKQVQDRNCFIIEEHSATGRAATEIRTASNKSHPVIILCVFLRLLMAIKLTRGTRLMGEIGAGKSTVCLYFCVFNFCKIKALNPKPSLSMRLLENRWPKLVKIWIPARQWLSHTFSSISNTMLFSLILLVLTILQKQTGLFWRKSSIG